MNESQSEHEQELELYQLQQTQRMAALKRENESVKTAAIKAAEEALRKEFLKEFATVQEKMIAVHKEEIDGLIQ